MTQSKATTSLAVSAALLFLAACESSGTESKATTSAQGEPEGSNTPKASAAAAAPEKADEPAPDTVNCLGIHECKGKSACHVVGGHACAGQNDCKGKGWIVVPKAECEAKGGKILEG